MNTIAIAGVCVPPGRRTLRGVDDLADSIREIGLLNPITVTRSGLLLAGYHRIEACKKLGWEKIPCTVFEPDPDKPLDVQFALAEVDENLVRNELTVLEHSEELARRKKLYETLYPEAPTGAGRPIIGKSFPNSFAVDTAAKTGVTSRTVRQGVQIASNLTDETKDAIRGTDLEDSKTDLLKLARMKPAEQAQVVEALKTRPIESVKKAVSVIRREERMADMGEPAPLDSGKRYGVIYADPPWPYDFSAKTADEIEEHYPTMTLEDLAELPVLDIASRDCVLFLWATNPKLKEAMQVIDRWGFSYRTNGVWVKDRIGLGYYFRQRHELLLIATRGTPPTPTPELRPDSVQEHPKTQHSAKPDAYYDLIETMYPGVPKIELFARQTREGWDSWGNQV